MSLYYITNFAVTFLVMTALASTSHATVTTFTGNHAVWQDTAGPYTTITFTEFPAGTLVTDQYSSVGVTMTNLTNYVSYFPNAFFEDGYGLTNHTGEAHVSLASPIHSLAVHFPGEVGFRLYLQGQLFYTSPLFIGALVNHFAGLHSTQEFDSIVFWNTGGIHIDNLYFGPPIPAPGAMMLLGVAAVIYYRRRR